jgi:hypothetical protein
MRKTPWKCCSMRVEAQGADGVRELRLFSPCPVCYGDVYGVDYNYDAGRDIPGVDTGVYSSGSTFTFSPCGHKVDANSGQFIYYLFVKDPEGKKAYNAQARKLHVEARRKSAEAGNGSGVRVRDDGYTEFGSYAKGTRSYGV